MYIGIDIGGTGIKAGLVDEKYNIVVKDSIPTPKGTYENMLNGIIGIAQKVASDGGCKMSDIKSIGIGCPGSVDDKKGIVTYSNNLDVPYMPLGPDISQRTGLPVYLGNDANCAALGEFFALDEDVENFVAITLGTGVGGGVVINKKLYTGFNGAAGELGHTLLTMNGEPCTCGRNGCWEAYASATALIRDTERAAKDNPDSILNQLITENGGKANGKIPFDAAEQGDEVAKNVVDNYIRYIAEGLINVMNIFQPEVVVIGGGVSKQGGTLIAPLRKYIKKYVYGSSDGVPIGDVRIAKLGNDAGIVGAALLGVNK